MQRFLILIVLIGTLCIPACSATPAIETPSTLEGTWTIRMTHSGGIAGISRSIEIASDGSYKVTDDYPAQTEKGRLSADEINELKQLVASLQYREVPRETGCADCFIYDIEIVGIDRPFKAHVDDVTLEESGLGPLIMQLRGIMEDKIN